jgi:hypothetical protein
MTMQAQATAVRHEIVVAAPLERAFTVFTEDFGRIKPREHNLLGVDIAETVFEPRAGGHIYDRGVDGSECRWPGCSPMSRLTGSCSAGTSARSGRSRRISRRRARSRSASSAETPERTRVELEHRNLDRHGRGWEGVRDGVDSEGGWPLYLQRYQDLLGS